MTLIFPIFSRINEKNQENRQKYHHGFQQKRNSNKINEQILITFGKYGKLNALSF